MYMYRTINTQPESGVTEASILQRICSNVYTNKVYIIYIDILMFRWMSHAVYRARYVAIFNRSMA